MKGDFSRVSFDPAKHFSRVLMQQGRVTLEADHNEQTAIALHLLRTLTGDLFGAYGGPAGGRGFFLYLANSRLMIGAGHYYVDGILCECEAKPGGGEYDYSSQPDFTPVNDAFLNRVVTLSIAHMAARLDPGPQIPDPCTIAPDARYRGAENQLYRIEIHQAGDAGSATFKWSRDNGSIVTRWLSTEGNDLIVTNARGFTAGDWVELSDDNMELGGSPGVLFKLASVQSDRLTIVPDSNKDQTIPVWQAPVNPKIRRWDQIENDAITLVQGAVRIVEMTAANPNWIDIEDGIQIQFTAGGTYRTADYWLIPARVATGGIDWPPTIGADGQPETGPDGQLIPAALAPAGIKHHYAPLGIVPDAALGVQDCRSCNSPLAIGKCGQTAGATVAPVAIIPKATLPAASLSGNIAPKKTLTPPGSSAGGKPVSKAKQKPKG